MNISLLFNISSDDRFSSILSIKIEKTTINQHIDKQFNWLNLFDLYMTYYNKRKIWKLLSIRKWLDQKFTLPEWRQAFGGERLWTIIVEYAQQFKGGSM